MGADADLRETFDPVDAWTPGRARRSVVEFAGRHVSDGETLHAIALCVSEAVTNVVVHAYRDREDPGHAIIEASVDDSALWITVRDDGCGLSPRADSPGMGMGLPLLSASASQLEIRTERRRGTEVRMRFDTGTVDGDAR